MIKNIPCDTKVYKKVLGQLSKETCSRTAANRIEVVPSQLLAEAHPQDNVRVYKRMHLCTQHTRAMERIYRQAWMANTWVLRVTNFKAAQLSATYNTEDN